MQKKYLTTKELADYLGLAVSTLATFRSDDKGPPYHKIGRLVRYRINEVEKWLKESRESAKLTTIMLFMTRSATDRNG